jgi:hypothetical protein
MSRVRRFAKSIVACTFVLTIAVSVIRPSQSLGQADSIKIGPDQSKASQAETFGWLRQRVPELATFTYRAGASVPDSNGAAPGTPGYIVTLSTAEFNQERMVFKWNAVTSCELQYEQGVKRVRESYTIPLKQLDPISFGVIGEGSNALFPDPSWRLEISAQGELKPIYVWETHDSKRVAETWTTRAQIRFGDQGSAERVGRALKHLAILCGARVDPF